jgi:hypothetical protein
LDTLKKNRTKIKEVGVKKLILFGSYALDKQKGNSDIDFLVEYKKGRGNYRDSLDLLHFLEDIFQKKIDLGEKNSIRKEFKSYILGSVQYEATI